MPTVPELPVGYTLRPAQPNDLAAVVDLINACALAVIGQATATLDLIRSEWQSPGFDLAGHARVVLAPDGEVAGYADYADRESTPLHPLGYGRVHPPTPGGGAARPCWPSLSPGRAPIWIESRPAR
jgi:hypothetical protein